MRRRIAFVTIGQAPRDDLVPEVLARMAARPEYREFGALDELSAEEIAAIAPKPGEERLVTRLRDGSEAIISKPETQTLLQRLFERLDGEGFDLIVLLCTGYFQPFRLRTPLIEAQLVVDHFVQGMTYGVRNLGVLVPNADQREEFHGIAGKEIRVAHASPYSDRRFAEASRELAGSDAVVMHCMGYTEAMRDQVVAATQRPVMLSRRLVAAAVDLMLE